jgi:hypothetical protein
MLHFGPATSDFDFWGKLFGTKLNWEIGGLPKTKDFRENNSVVSAKYMHYVR